MASEKGKNAISEALSSQRAIFERAMALMMETQCQDRKRLENIERSTSLRCHSSAGQKDAVRKVSLSDTKLLANTRPGSKEDFNSSPSASHEDVSFATLRMRFLHGRKCEPWCECSCHRQTRAETPRMLQSVIGMLFVGYTGLPLLSPPCNNRKCYRSSNGFLQVNYYFPQWFLSKMVSIAIRYNEANIRNPEIFVRTLHVRSSYEGIFQSSSNGDANAVKYFLESRKASVVDVTNDSGHSPLHV